MKMFGASSTSSQYLHPDYISPLPTTLDAKNSPLALLAQTCSSIGHDLGPTKHSPDKKSSKENHRSGSSGSNTSSSVDEKKTTPERSRISGSSSGDKHVTTTKSQSSTINNNNSKSTSSSSGLKGGSKPSQSHRKDVRSPSSASRDQSLSLDKQSSRSSSAQGQVGRERVGGGSPLAGSGAYGSSSHPHNERRSVSPTKNQHSSSIRNSSPTALPPSFVGSVPPLLYPPPGALSQLTGAYPFPFDLFSYSAAAAAAAASVAAAQSAAAAAAGKMPHSLMSSYLSGYPRSSGLDGRTTPIESCKDPYCSHCTGRGSEDDRSSVCPHLGSSCPQCNRAKSIGVTVSSGAPGVSPHVPSAASLAGLPSLYPGASLFYPGSPFGSLLPGSMLGSMPAYVCPVMLPGVGELCGKRCSSSDEFIQHLRTHTPPFADPGVLGGGSYPSPSQYALSSLSQRSLAGRSFYPLLDSLGPSASSLRPSPYSHPTHSSLLSSRFHPYKPPGSDLTSGLSSYAASAQALEAYRTLHAQRAMGAIAP